MMLRHRNAYFATLTLVLGVGATASAPPRAKPLPEGAEKKTVTIYSDGTKMIGDLYLPPGLQKADKRPAVVFCNVTGRIAPEQLTATKLQRLMDRYAGKEWLPTPLKHLDQPDSEKADVLRGLRT